MGLSIPQLATKLQTEADAYKFLEALRWPDGEQVCPHCGTVDKHYFLKPSNGSSRKTRTGTPSQRRVWKCRACRKQFSVLTGTIFHGSKIPVRTWVFVVFEMASSKNGVSAREIERKYGLTPKSAWFLCHRIREAMKREPLSGLLSGRVVADETFFGGKPSNRHGHDPKKHVQGHHDRTPILSLVSRCQGSPKVPIGDRENSPGKKVIRSRAGGVSWALQWR
jgi:transposase-like protein